MRDNKKEAKEIGEILGDVVSGSGFNTDFAPVADIDEGRAVIGDRAFRGTPTGIGEKVADVVSGLASKNVISCLKHFPGHGTALADTHEGISVSNRSYSDFKNIDFIPFKAGINAGVDMVMVGHITAPSLDPSGKSASLSKKIVTDILREELGFEGVIITDSLAMKAISEDAPKAALEAVLAGNDILLGSPNFVFAKEKIKEAVLSSEIPEARIDQSVIRILNMKISHGLII
jgi:beta-N-acetylhexosaminidase